MPFSRLPSPRIPSVLKSFGTPISRHHPNLFKLAMGITLRQIFRQNLLKFGIGLLLSHQHTKQLTEKLLGEVLGNTATKTIFRVSGEDALTLARGINMRHEKNLANILVSLPDGSAVVKLRAGFGQEPIRPFEIYTLPPLKRSKLI